MAAAAIPIRDSFYDTVPVYVYTGLKKSVPEPASSTKAINPPKFAVRRDSRRRWYLAGGQFRERYGTNHIYTNTMSQQERLAIIQALLQQPDLDQRLAYNKRQNQSYANITVELLRAAEATGIGFINGN